MHYPSQIHYPTLPYYSTLPYPTLVPYLDILSNKYTAAASAIVTMYPLKYHSTIQEQCFVT